MALLFFAEKQAQAAVLEVGLGGRLDSTNVCQPAVSVITSISYDHMRQLGNTLAEIAFEKAGIVKPGIPLVSGVTADEPRQVIEQVCRDRGSPLVQLGRDFDFRYYPPHLVDHHAGFGRIDYLDRSTKSPGLAGVTLGMLGRHQGANAAVAVATIAQLQAQGWQIDEAQLRAGLASARSPARVEVVARRPTIVIDAAHNEASVEALLETLADSFTEQPRILIFATTQEKEVRAMMRLLLPRFDHVVLTRYRNNPRGVPVEELAEIAAELGAANWRIYADPAEAWEAARAIATPDHLLCVTGSFFIAAEIGAEIRRNPLALADANSRPA
jgi:dihydrofolate synthase/folylpolyglutamate synthase